jgi:hypothetical protein
MSKSVRIPQQRITHLRSSSPAPVMTAAPMSLPSCSNCQDFPRVAIRVDGVELFVDCPVCQGGAR